MPTTSAGTYHREYTSFDRVNVQFFRAAFSGTRIILRQVSPESESIFDFIISLHNACNGDWKSLQTKADISDDELEYFLEYAAMFLGNCGNYKGLSWLVLFEKSNEGDFSFGD